MQPMQLCIVEGKQFKDSLKNPSVEELYARNLLSHSPVKMGHEKNKVSWNVTRLGKGLIKLTVKNFLPGLV